MQILTPLLRKTAHSKVSVIKTKKKTLTYVYFLNATIEKNSSIVRNSLSHPPTHLFFSSPAIKKVC